MPKLKLHDFNSPTDPLVELGNRGQVAYLRHYLADLGAKSVLEEKSYFDRDYLSEFSAFYGVSSRGYSNKCRHCSFFSERVKREHPRAAAGGSQRALERLQDAYLGFVIIRPIPSRRQVKSAKPSPLSLRQQRILNYPEPEPTLCRNEHRQR